MAIAFSLSIPKEAAAQFCESSEAGRLINDRLSRKLESQRPLVFYSSTAKNTTGFTTGNSVDLDSEAILVFSRDKKHLIRCLRGAAEKEFWTRTRMISIVANSYSGSRLKIVLESIANPFAALNKKRAVNWRIFKNSGGFSREKEQDIVDLVTKEVTTVKAAPIEYEPWGSFFNASQGATSARSGYYIVVAASRDLASAYDVLGKRSYSAPRERLSAGAVASLLNFA